MKCNSAFYRDLTLAAINGLAEYYETMESQLQSLKVEDRNKIHADIKNLKLNREDEMVEEDIAIQQHTTKYDMLFTNFFRYSFVVLLFFVVEKALRDLCFAVEDVKPISMSPPEPSRDIIKSYKQYLNEAQVSVPNQLWESIHKLNKIRNCIVHASGYIERCIDKQHLRKIAKQGIGILISGDNYQGDLDPLYLEGNMLVLEPAYCRRIVSDVRRLFERLCDAVPLHRIHFI